MMLPSTAALRIFGSSPHLSHTWPQGLFDLFCLSLPSEKVVRSNSRWPLFSGWVHASCLGHCTVPGPVNKWVCNSK
jgi:hypothetical protein